MGTTQSVFLILALISLPYENRPIIYRDIRQITIVDRPTKSLRHKEIVQVFGLETP